MPRSIIDTKKIEMVGKVLVAAGWLGLMNMHTSHKVPYLLELFGAAFFVYGKLLPYSPVVSEYARTELAKMLEQSGLGLLSAGSPFILISAITHSKQNPELPVVLCMLGIGLLTIFTASSIAKQEQKAPPLPPPATALASPA